MTDQPGGEVGYMGHSAARVVGALGLACLIGLAAGGFGCSDRTVDEGLPEQDRFAACLWVVEARGLDGDGEHVSLITDEARGTVGTVCLCLTEREMQTRSRHDELNDLGLEECERLATLDPRASEFVSTSCEELHATGDWLDVVIWVHDDWWPGNTKGLAPLSDDDCRYP